MVGAGAPPSWLAFLWFGVSRTDFKRTVLEDRILVEFLAKIHLKQVDALRLLAAYNKVDSDRSGKIDIGEFFDYFNIEHSAYNVRAFKLLAFSTQDGSGGGGSGGDGSGGGGGDGGAEDAEMSFAEFLVSMYSYCTQSHGTLVRFSFRIISAGKRYITLGDVGAFVALLITNPARHQETTASMMQVLDSEKTGRVAWEQFLANEKKLGSMLYPAFRLQKMLRNKSSTLTASAPAADNRPRSSRAARLQVLSRRFWARAARGRAANAGADAAINDLAAAIKDAKHAARRAQAERERPRASSRAYGGGGGGAAGLHMVTEEGDLALVAAQRAAAHAAQKRASQATAPRVHDAPDGGPSASQSGGRAAALQSPLRVRRVVGRGGRCCCGAARRMSHTSAARTGDADALPMLGPKRTSHAAMAALPRTLDFDAAASAGGGSGGGSGDNIGHRASRIALSPLLLDLAAGGERHHDGGSSARHHDAQPYAAAGRLSMAAEAAALAAQLQPQQQPPSRRTTLTSTTGAGGEPARRRSTVVAGATGRRGSVGPLAPLPAYGAPIPEDEARSAFAAHHSAGELLARTAAAAAANGRRMSKVPLPALDAGGGGGGAAGSRRTSARKSVHAAG
ncbi:hypothetical protein JKP88DRAFT_286058 [Tribonema minus]|uniref:EF-hand domain-containing protein n=1 Tax=Tribonema minus TaxID=303371 RepID=A0A835ZE72_9STRA|nr:hypothetical protein JKP88DRAFT_286058 [Tribonema minus]